MRITVAFILASVALTADATYVSGQAAGDKPKASSGYVMAGDLKTLYLEWGSRNSETFVLLHGLYDEANIWKPLAEELATHYRVIAIDRRGAGKTAAPVDGYEASTLAGDLAAFLHAIRLDRPHIVGHSAGANVALTFAAMAPERVSTVVLIDGGFWPIGPEPTEPPRPECNKRRKDCRRKLAIERGTMQYDPEPLFPQVKVPVLLVVAIPTNDVAIKNAEMLAEMRSVAKETAANKFAKGHLEFINDSSHWIQTDQPKRLAGSITGFLKANRTSESKK